MFYTGDLFIHSFMRKYKGILVEKLEILLLDLIIACHDVTGVEFLAGFYYFKENSICDKQGIGFSSMMTN